MGADYPGQENAIAELNALSEEAKGYLKHHLRNSLGVILGNAYLINKSFSLELSSEKAEVIEEAVNHIVEDLERIGC